MEVEGWVVFLRGMCCEPPGVEDLQIWPAFWENNGKPLGCRVKLSVLGCSLHPAPNFISRNRQERAY